MMMVVYDDDDDDDDVDDNDIAGLAYMTEGINNGTISYSLQVVIIIL